MAKYVEMGKIKRIDPQTLTAFGRQVRSGEVRIYTGSDLVPEGIPWGGSDCNAVVIAASISAGSPIYAWQGLRASPDFLMPHKTDVALYAPDGSGGAFRHHMKPAGYHHNYNVTQTGLAGLIQDNHLPTASELTVNQFRANGACMIF